MIRNKQLGDGQDGEGDGRVTLRAVAERLQLHPATVSVVLNDIPGRRIARDTRRRIKEAARAMGYTPNVVAQSLRTGRTKAIGVILPGICGMRYSLSMNGVGDRLTKDLDCYMGLHHCYDPSEIRRNISSLIRREVEGLILIDCVLVE